MTNSPVEVLGINALSLVARRQLGEALLELFGPPDLLRKKGLGYRAFHCDDYPNFVFVGVTSSGYDRQMVIECSLQLLGAALSHFGKTDGMVIADRDGAGFEIALFRDYAPTSNDRQTAKERFAHLRVMDRVDRML